MIEKSNSTRLNLATIAILEQPPKSTLVLPISALYDTVTPKYWKYALSLSI